MVRHDADAVLAARDAGRADRMRFEAAVLLTTDARWIDVVTMYLPLEVNLRLRPRLVEQLRPGTRVVSHAFDMGDRKPDAKPRAGGSTVYRWRIPDTPPELAERDHARPR
ncbi:hypothetical protein ABS767_16240 [Sphingomonas sp. ST-64]|uniref:Uncharacterized protein n=1 Tax=Sphingomonas plantiphila TaxID=3163295 RepID=A0ABW8YTN2_9SPHN